MTFDRVEDAEHLKGLLVARQPLLWINPKRSAIKRRSNFTESDVRDADRRLRRFAPLLEILFPELAPSSGLIESPLLPVPRLQKSFAFPSEAGRWFVKADHSLPVAGSIKARGGIYEVLAHAEALAIQEGLLKNDDLRGLNAQDVRERFGRHRVSVGSTGNLGLSIGIVAAKLGFVAEVHMSREAKTWKKELLRAHGATVVEHSGDFGDAVAAGRDASSREPDSYFVDDEKSRLLFLGYSVAALRLLTQLEDLGIAVDAAHPLFVYMPCGVGGAASGIAFALNELLGRHVHCFLAEPVAYPSMLMRLAFERPGSVTDLGLGDFSEADGLAVAQASELAACHLDTLVSGIFTVEDDILFEDLYRADIAENLRVEPSAAAAFRGPLRLNSPAGTDYVMQNGLVENMASSTHILWTTGGALVPEEEYLTFRRRGEHLVG